ncbi:MAG: tRNA (guanosine(37)-N1)-methyltransferase TrmD [Clostridia bacterium]|nr:tRNA (guanosine(37)-N1)-methyltransferase TrmD [Clostridia bacterium]
MTFNILTIFPDIFAPVENGVVGRAAAKGIIGIRKINIRDFTLDKHGNTDDYPYGGGDGMLMTAQPVTDAWRSIGNPGLTVLLSPKGPRLDQCKCMELASLEHITLVCGRYEGLDQRIIDSIVDEEISIGDYVISGGEIAAMVLVDAVSRMVPGVLGNENGGTNDSHFNGLLEYPQYTRPEVFEGIRVPDVLLSGNHEEIRKYRLAGSLLETFRKRPDMLAKRGLSRKEAELLSALIPGESARIIALIKE